MRKKYFDISILEDAHALGWKETGYSILETIILFLNKDEIIIIERRPVNDSPVEVQVLKKDNSEGFINHWKKLLENL